MSRAINRAAVAAMASRPGIDPRVWLTLASVTALGFDPNEGVFADVHLMPGGEPETAYLGSPYAGEGYGDHCPVDVGDTVLVAIPLGDPGNGPIIVGRFHQANAKPNVELAGPTNARVIRVKAGEDLRIIVSGAGSVNITLEGGGQIRLGSESVNGPLQGVVQGQAFDTFTGATQAALGNTSTVVAAVK